MFLPVDTKLAVAVIAFSFIFELLRIVVAYQFGKPPDKLRQLLEQKAETNLELADIKSVNLEFVKHSKLSRKVIKIEKEIETIQLTSAPRIKKVKYVSRVFRAIVYLAASIYFWGARVAIFAPKILWPLNWLTSSKLVSLPVWGFLIISALAWRHVFRTVLIVFGRGLLELP